MADSIIRKQILDHLDHMPYELQKKVLEFMDMVTEEPKKSSKEDLLQLVGCIDKKDLEIMKVAIEEGCEQIDPEGWEIST